MLRGKFYLRYDDQYLWLRRTVADESPAKNAAQDPETAFTLGDSVDFYFGTDPAAARTPYDRRSPVKCALCWCP